MRTWPALEVGPPADRDLFEAALVDYGVTAVDSPDSSDALRVFFASEEQRLQAEAGLRARFPDLTILPVEVPDEDWVSRSQSNLRAVRVGDIVVAPPWDVPVAGVTGAGFPDAETARPAPRHVIVIQPSMGFGTGHHATTRLCLEALQQLPLTGRSVLDVGTGSGLLAIAAQRLGAADVLGIDNDMDAVEASRENLALNAAVSQVTIRAADLRSMTAGAFDVITANLTGALLQEAAGRLASLARPHGNIILSGFTHAEADDVLAAYSRFLVSARREEDEWVCVTLHRP
jgi:ribosomal protein L11 methyltransferase